MAYLLARGQGETKAASAPYHVIGGHLAAVISGLTAFHTLASGLLITDVLESGSAAFSLPLVRLSASSIVVMMLTTIGMLVSETNHPVACATTLIVSLGLLSTLTEAAYIMLAVVILVGAHEWVIYPATVRLGIEPKNPRETH